MQPKVRCFSQLGYGSLKPDVVRHNSWDVELPSFVRSINTQTPWTWLEPTTRSNCPTRPCSDSQSGPCRHTYRDRRSSVLASTLVCSDSQTKYSQQGPCAGFSPEESLETIEWNMVLCMPIHTSATCDLKKHQRLRGTVSISHLPDDFCLITLCVWQNRKSKIRSRRPYRSKPHLMQDPLHWQGSFFSLYFFF